ncbi:Methyl-CpG DNA binding,F-box domain,Leucine-rich repeat domain, L domain-like,DNA-binding domain [Cinara cedri]|uniref:Methyl-CpG DNA binding,F-box domain,Leucine-rich repeat domain, L domain-like,DNA-binding domain n=1 Tax=Cinara cedri TaxID=506608 RepID=A0A5E4N959_9HEMI|nr:Methyl-CpG DNA binding,F-box domain,Leucine-rich repeat domain, L domain-like,DNA-binding domain [Cinara cedri]
MASSSGASTSSSHIDITNPKYKLPFAHGWKREVVYRTPKSDDSTTTSNKTNRKADVYYYSPGNLKFRSLVDFQKDSEALNFPLTIDNFSFKKEPTGIDDPSKEIIRDAKFHPTKDGNVFESYVSKMLRDRSVNVSSTASQPKRRKLNNMDLDNFKNVKKRSSEINENINKSLEFVFPYLGMKDRLTVTQVCFSWRRIAKDKCLWKHVCLKNVKISDWKKLIDFINNNECISLDTRGLLMPSTKPKKIHDFYIFWLNFSKAIIKATKLDILYLYGCPVNIVQDVMCSLQKLTNLNVSSLQFPPKFGRPGTPKILNELNSFNLDCISNMQNLTELRIHNLRRVKLLSTPNLKVSRLTKLKTLSLTSITFIKAVPDNFIALLESISIDLEVLEIGECKCLPNNFHEFLEKLTNLRSLRLENCFDRWEACTKQYFDAIRSLKKLENLELINIIMNKEVESQLKRCSHIKALMIAPIDPYRIIPHSNRIMFNCLEALSKTLTHVVWGIREYMLAKVDYLIENNIQKKMFYPGYYLGMSKTRKVRDNIIMIRSKKLQPGIQEAPPNNPYESEEVDIFSVSFIEYWLNLMMVNAKTKVIKIPDTGKYKPRLSELFGDLK